MHYNILFLALLLVFGLSQKTIATSDQSAAQRLHEQACSITPYIGDDPWHITNLYNCANRELFIPYQLWTGAAWDGDKNSPCMHAVDTNTILNKPDENYARGRVIIKGPVLWKDDLSSEMVEVWERVRPHRNSNGYYACHPRGIGKVHNKNKPHGRFVRGLCFAPGGFGWKINRKRTCIKTTLEIVDLTLNENNLLSSLAVKFWFRDKLKYRYVYQPGKGTTQIKLY
ncbi:MAG: hypothetical protein ACRBHB_12600 [Arenicella sp.]